MSLTITPGEILLEDYLKPMEISAVRMARAIGVDPRIVEEILQGRRSITPEISILIGAFFGQSDTFWQGIQSECDVRKVAASKPDLKSGISPAQSMRRRAGEAQPAAEAARPAPASGDMDFTP